MTKVSLVALREALEASWGVDTAYLYAEREGNPALGNCYPTSRVVQHYFPKAVIIEGQVWTGKQTEKHFWNMIIIEGQELHVDLTWQQFPHGSVVKEYKIRERATLGDDEDAIRRVDLLMKRVKEHLAKQ